ncbi:MAG TPA: PepSY domain-containing protein [Armatimonadota bacterium]|nr:PepSY domain-containing protein [Armatimonadota bacterium]
MNLNRMLKGVTLGVGLLALLTTTSFAKGIHRHFSITAHKAENIVLKKFPHGQIMDKTKLENEEGIWQYGVMVQNGKILREVMVNAKTGHIDSVEVTNAAKERDEAKADVAAAKTSSKTTSEKGEAGEQGEHGETD